MPRAVDRRNIEPEGDPTRSGTEFHVASLQGPLDGLLGAVTAAIEYFKTQIVEIIKDLTGIDLASWDAFIASLFDGKGFDLAWIFNIVGSIVDAFDGIALAPGAISDFITSAVSNIIGDIVEVFTGEEDGDLDDLGTWINTNIREPIEAAAAAFASILSKIFLIDDLMEIISGVEDGDTNDVGTFVGNIVNGIQTTVDVIVNALFGWIGEGWGSEDAHQALADEAATVADLSAAVQALQSNQNNQNVGGKAAFVDFSLRSNTTGMGTDFDLSYSGSGTGYLAIVDGDVVWVSGNNDPRTGIFRYNVLETVTDYQKVGIAFGSAPERGTSNPARNYVHARKNSAGTSYIYADLTKDSVELGCVVSGSKTVFVLEDDEFSFKANSIYWLECGTVGGLRVFRVIEGSTPVLTHTEVGTTSQVGASYRGGGGGVYAYANSFGFLNRPGKMLAFGISDNQPHTVVGSGARMYRTSTDEIDVADGTHVLPNSFFNSLAEHTADITPDLTTGRFTVSIDGWYDIDVRAATSAFTTSSSLPGSVSPFPMHLALFKNGTAEHYIGDVIRPYGYDVSSSSTFNVVSPEAVSGSCRVYLQATDYVQIGYNADGSRSDFFTGDAGGLSTFFSITLANRSLA